MAKNFEVNFTINGNDNLSAAIKSAQSALKSLKNIPTKITAPTDLAGLQRALALYKNLQAALRQSSKEFQAAAKAQAQLNQAQQRRARAEEKLNNLTNQRAQAQAQLARARADFASLRQSGADKAALANQRAEIARLNADYKNLQGQVKAAREEYRSANSDYRTASNANNAAQKLIQNYRQQADALRQLHSSLSTSSLGNIVANENALAEAVARANRELQHQQQLTRFNQASQDLNNAYNNFNNAVDTARTILNPFEEAAQNAITFEQMRSRVKALTQMRNIKEGRLDQVEREMELLTAQAEHLGATTEFTRLEVAAAQSYFGMAGWDTEKILAGVKPVLDLTSIAGDRNLPRMADIVSDLMTAMKLKPGQMIRVGDQWVEATEHFKDAMAYSITQSNMDKEAFFEAHKYSAPIAADAGLSVGESAAVQMVVANSGIKGSMAGTGMRAGLLVLANANKKAQAAMEELGIESSDARKRVAEANDALNEMGVTGTTFTERMIQFSDALSKMSDGNERLAYISRIFPRTATTFWTKLLGDPESLKQFIKYAQEIDNGYATGWGTMTADIMRDNTQTHIEYLKSALDALQGAIGDALHPTLRALADALTPVVMGFAEWARENPRVVQACAALATAISAAIVAVAGFSLAMAGINFAQAGFAMLTASIASATRAALAFCMTPLGAALAALALAAYFVYENWYRIGPAIQSVVNSLSTAFDPVINNLMTSLGALGAAFETLFGSSFFSSLGTALSQSFVTFGGVALTVLATIATALADVIKTAADLLTDIGKIGSALADLDFEGFVKGVAGLKDNFIDNNLNIWKDMYNVMGEGMSATYDAVQMLNRPTVSDKMHAGILQPESTAPAQTLPMTMPPEMDWSQVTQPLTDGATQAGEALIQIPPPAQEVATNLTNTSTNAQTAGTQFQAAGEAAQSAVGKILSMSEAAGQVAGALAAKATEIGAIHIPQPQLQIVTMTATAPATAPAQNATGGIYSKGEFLTTFAENSAEAAIPIDNSPRALSLWERTGELLGVNQSENATFNISVNVNVAGNGDRADIQSGIHEAAFDLEERLERFWAEKRRRSFA